ncbi:hypothetical protein [Flavobacterium sp. 1355]|uniref:hypothetical protein n=1 Tax=Flavobacterium sp. 1355 TaxID=2806571 RepID=UPI001AE5151F|nr:hypothetical protein [Flavobacterium sp. 1355]MBP1221981.1 hypothetical protein [Flavobacterium sp. 1355]
MPFISESLAAQAAEVIGNNNQTEMGISAVVGAFSGFMFGFGFGWGALAQFVVWTGVGHYVISPAVNLFGDTTGSVLGNDTYDEIKNNSYKSPEWWENPNEDVQGISPNDNYDLHEGLQDAQGLIQLKKLMMQNGADKNDIAQINEAIKAAQNNGGSLAADNNPLMREILIKIKNGEFGPGVKDIYTNRDGNMRGMNTEANAREAISSKETSIKNNRMVGLKGAGAAIQLLQPFICAFIGERAIRLGAEIFDQDTGNSISVKAMDY